MADIGTKPRFEKNDTPQQQHGPPQRAARFKKEGDFSLGIFYYQ
jgi:hypothetical protein